MAETNDSAPKGADPEILSSVMQADRHRLLSQWRRLSKKSSSGDTEQRAAELAKWQQRAEESKSRREQRDASVPELTYDDELPISSHREEIIELLKKHQTIVVCGETGSGKSTQLPKILLEAGLGRSGVIGHTQPRRLAARAVAKRLAEELRTRVGGKVGFKVRFTDTTSNETLVKLMTDGVLLAETQSDKFLDRYDAIIIDEAHERSLNIDFLLGYIRNISAKRPDLKIVITSATIDTERFAEHFNDEHGPAPIVEVSGRTYPVETRYMAADPDTEQDEETEQLSRIADAADELFIEGDGDILVFLPTERDIRLAAKHLRGHFTNMGARIEILPLYARLSQADQDKIFSTTGGRRIVLATNVAESSLTVPGIRYVIDTGLVRISRYAARSRVQRLPIEPVSKASADQRKGRCGRLGPGVCIRLYSEDDYNSRPKFTTPEIRRSDLASVLLQSKVLRLGDLESFPVLDPPSPEALRDAAKTLREIGAIEPSGRLTKIGTWLGKLPCDPRVGRMLWESGQRGCTAEVVVIAAALECQDVRQRPAGLRDQADAAHKKYVDPHSDFLTYLRLWDFFDHVRSSLSRSKQKKALTQAFLSVPGMHEWSDMVRQFRDLLHSAGMKVGQRKIKLPSVDWDAIEADQQEQRNPKKGQKPKLKLKRPDGYAAIHQSLLTGLLSGVAHRGDRHEYKAIGGMEASLWPGSGLFRRKPRWIVAGEIVETTRRYARTVAEVDVEWIEQAAKDLLKHTYLDPHWSEKSGAAMVYRKSTLYGLTVAAGRRIQLAPINSDEARTLMIEHGLVEGQWRCNEAFYQHNRELLADMHELVQRTRSRDYILDRFHLAAFYQSRIPEQVYDLTTLKKWVAANRGTAEEKALWMQPEDLLKDTGALHAVEENFPNEIEIGATKLPVEYRYEPGHEEDGVVVTVPQAALRQVSEGALGWLVPGLLEEKILHLIRSLPKSLRTSFVPAPDVARLLATTLASNEKDRSFSEVLCKAMSDYAGERITPSAFQLDKLPQHLRMSVRVVDDDGKLLDAGRDVASLQSKYALQAEPDAAVPDSQGDWENRTVRPDKFEDYPQQVTIIRGGVKVAAFPCLTVVSDQEVQLRLAETQAEAEEKSRAGLTQLLTTKHHRTLRAQVANLPEISQSTMRLSHLVPSKELARQLEQLIARIALIEDREPIYKATDWEARNAMARREVTIATQDVAAWLPSFAKQVHAVRLLREKAPAPWAEVFEQVDQQLEWLFPDGFMSIVPWTWLKHYPRYLSAIEARVEKLRSGGLPKDRRLRAPIESLLADYDIAIESEEHHDAFDKHLEARWMIEELRVNIFAQQLGTVMSVSEKRIRKQLEL